MFGKKETEDEEEARALAFEQFERENPRCKTCGEPAVQPSPLVDRSWLDSLPIFSWFNRLYSMPWRYVVKTPHSFDAELCSLHHKQATAYLEHFIADLRSGHATFNAGQLEKVSVMNRGGLNKFLREREEKARKAFEMPSEPLLTEGDEQ